jgi:hypothetical protein
MAACLVILTGVLGTAQDTPTAEEEPRALFAYSSGKCIKERGVEPPTDEREPFRAPESVLTWRFEDVLELEFQVWGNCCPDSERFVVTGDLQGDTLAITVVDTAASLCRCVCPYTVTTTCDDTTRHRYVVTGLLGKDHEIFPPTEVTRGGAGPSEDVEEETGSERTD